MRSACTAFGAAAFIVAGLAGCSASVDAPPAALEPLISSPGPYTAAVDAPVFCGEFTDTTALSGVPTAIAALAADSADSGALAAVQAAAGKVRTIADLAAQDGTHADVTQAASDLAEQLDAAPDTITEEALTSISALLDRLGSLVQPVCDLPT